MGDGQIKRKAKGILEEGTSVQSPRNEREHTFEELKTVQYG